MEDRDKQKQTRRDFFKGFFLTLVFIFPVYAGALLFSSLGGLLLPETEQTAQPQENVPVAESVKSYNLLFGVYDSNQEDKLLALTLLRFDTASYRTVICDLPVDTVVLDAKTPRGLGTVFASRGMLGIVDTVQETLNVAVSGYAAVGTQELAQLIDELGQIEYNLGQDIVVYDESGIVTYSKHAGSSLFNGNDVAKLLVFSPQTGQARTRMLESLWDAAMTAYADASFDQKILRGYQVIVNSMSSNISSAGIYTLARSVKAVCADGRAQYELYRLDGTWLDGRFELAQDADERFWDYFPPIS